MAIEGNRVDITNIGDTESLDYLTGHVLSPGDSISAVLLLTGNTDADGDPLTREDVDGEVVLTMSGTIFT